MKKVILIFLCVLLGPLPSHAVDVKIRGAWDFGLELGQGGDLISKYNGQHRTGMYGNSAGGDSFNALQRLRTWLFFRVSENLQGVLMFKIPERNPMTWGYAFKGGALGADGNQLQLSSAAIDWQVPKSKLRFRMGLQYITFPAFTGQNIQLANTAMGTTANYQVNEHASITGMWMRPFNDNWAGAGSGAFTANYLDNVDIFGLFLPLTFDGIKCTPWVVGGMVGRNARTGEYTYTNMFWDKDLSNVPYNQGRPINPNWRRDLRRLDPYGSLFMAGFTGEITRIEPFRFAWDFQYAGMKSGYERYDRGGFVAALLAEYRMDWGIPGIFGWYASGEDDDVANGSERIFVMSPLNYSGRNDFSALAFYGAQNQSVRQGILANTYVGTWGMGARIKDFSLFDNLKQTVRFLYINGSNQKESLGRYDRFAVQVPANGDYLLTTNENAWELSLSSEYKIYENLKLYSELGYLGLNRQDYSARGREEKCDAWNCSLALTYEF